MHGIVRTDRMLATVNPAGLVSVRYQPNGEMSDIDNGNVVMISVLESDSVREVFVGETPTSVSNICDVVLIASPELMHDNKKRGLPSFYNKSGSICRGYHIYDTDIFSVTEEDLTGEKAEVGKYVELCESTRFNVVSAMTGATVVGTIIGINVVDGSTYYVIRVSSRPSVVSSGTSRSVSRIPDEMIQELFS